MLQMPNFGFELSILLLLFILSLTGLKEEAAIKSCCVTPTPFGHDSQQGWVVDMIAEPSRQIVFIFRSMLAHTIVRSSILNLSPALFSIGVENLP